LYAGFTVVIVEAPTLIVVLLFWLMMMTYMLANQNKGISFRWRSDLPQVLD